MHYQIETYPTLEGGWMWRIIGENILAESEVECSYQEDAEVEAREYLQDISG